MKPGRIQSVLIANRGEIAVRIIRACRELGIRTAAVYSDVDRRALHVRMADQAYSLRGTTAAETYLHKDKLIGIAREARIDAVHPGYGFLSENPDFAARLEREGITFVGPTSSAIHALGDKTKARKLATKLGIPIVAGTLEPLGDDKEAIHVAEQIGFPVLLKASAGGGGKGMRIVRTREEFLPAVKTARSEARSGFGDDRVYLERYINKPRHVEVQVLADQYGSVVHLGERECSIQRRHQKVIEESPSMAIDETMRTKMGESAVALAREAGYTNAGTVEFLLDEKKDFYFLEVNTRLQVEHPVTELRTGIDIVKQQLSIAGGNPLQIAQTDVRFHGHVLECRIYAEDPANDFFPSTGVLRRYRPAQGPQVRVDNGFEEGIDVSVYYDPMLAKVITWGKSRADATAAMKRALHEFEIQGVQSTIPFCLFVLNHESFISGNFSTRFVEEHFASEQQKPVDQDELLAAAVGAFLIRKNAGERRDIENHQSKSSSQWKKLRTETYRS
ncbi:MAG: acetyl-CoA carboxylase biotin carboxylase subunit [Ignavibacteriales bacterium]|nr:acetyl-CoA carboxylase biotin carboxylase subunit [Ignavibacteriales bacterium]